MATGQKRCKRLSQLVPLHTAVRTDEQTSEEPLVDESPDMRRCVLVLHLAIGCGLQCLIQRRLDVPERHIGVGDLCLSVGQTSGKAVHLTGKQVLGDGTGVVGIKELLALVLQFSSAPFSSLDTGFSLALLAGHLIVHAGADVFDALLTHLEASIECGNALLDALQTNG